MSTIDGAPTGLAFAQADGAWTVQPGPTPIGAYPGQQLPYIVSPLNRGQLNAGAGDVNGPYYNQGQPMGIKQRIMQLFTGRDPNVYRVEQDSTDGQIMPHNRQNLDYGFAPGRIPYLWRDHIGYWAGLSQHGLTQNYYTLRLPVALFNYSTRGTRSIYGINAGSPNYASTGFIPAMYVPTAF